MKKQSAISRIYNTLLYCAGLGVFCLALVTAVRNVGSLDSRLSGLSPYSTLADWVNIHAQSGLRLRIPQPIFVKVKETENQDEFIKHLSFMTVCFRSRRIPSCLWI